MILYLQSELNLEYDREKDSQLAELYLLTNPKRIT